MEVRGKLWCGAAEGLVEEVDRHVLMVILHVLHIGFKWHLVIACNWFAFRKDFD